MKTISNEILFSRNRGLVSPEEQTMLANTSIAMIGTGGDGGLLAERLVRFGIGKIILADPEFFEPANCNRQFAAYRKNMGRNKAEAVADELRMINPNLIVEVYNEGITSENLSAIVAAADIVVDEIEYSLPALSVMLHREARKQNKHVFMGANIGWGASCFCFAPNGTTFEEHFEYDETNGTINPLRYLKSVPDYLDNEMLEAVLMCNMPMPSLSSSVSLVASMVANEIILFRTGKRNPLIVPQFITIDLFNLTINTQ